MDIRAKAHRAVKMKRRVAFRVAALRSSSLTVEVRGIKFVCHTWDRSISRDLAIRRSRIEFRVLERAVDELKRQGFNPAGMVFVDVGANIGTACLPALAWHGFKSAVAIEPEPRNAAALREAAVLNGVANRLTVIEAAASNDTGGASLTIRAKSGKNYLGNRDGLRVSTVTLDGLNLAPHSSLIWIDVQGHEAEVLDGASELLLGDAPFVVESRTRDVEALTLLAPGRKTVDLRATSSRASGRYTDVLLLPAGQ